ncbi:MAG: DNA methyltransferase [Candidatus Omnitrophica bacterium]|nr:DNA methyltransferase [Candidatus Omnitrophota bacterium]
MPIMLEQSKLDVINKSRSNIFNWRGQFTPQFVEYILHKFSSKGDVILDPFCGSGTVLRESAMAGFSAVGLEINPAAYAMAKFYSLCNLNINERQEMFNSLTVKINKAIMPYGSMPLLNLDRALFRDRYRNLLGFGKQLLEHIKEKQEKLLALLILFYAEDSPREDLLSAIYKAQSNLSDHLLSLPYTKVNIQAELCDARLSHQCLQSKVNLIITSPPYINVFNYHQNYRAIIELLGFDILKVAESEMGSNRKNRGNRYKTVLQYCLDMELVLQSLANSLSPNGHLIMVIGRESRVRGIPFYNSLIVKEIILSLKCFKLCGVSQRGFVNRFGEKIYEDILIVQRNNVLPQLGNGRDIAMEHLKKGLIQSEKDVRIDILTALAESKLVTPSPLFDGREII